jgi:hypothetical protein
MRISAPVAATFLLLLASNSLFAKATTFRNAGLKNETLVTLEVSDKTATGTFVSHDYMEDAGPGVAFTGKVIPTPKGKPGVYLEIQFTGPAPYNTPPGVKQLIWHLTIVKHRAHLFIPVQERNYEDRTPRWVVDDLELEPVTGDE